MNNFSILLNTLRKEKGWTQTELAEKTGVTNQAVSKWETGESYPETSILIKLSELFDVSVDDLLKGNNSKKQSVIERTVPNKCKTKFAVSLAIGISLIFAGIIAVVLYGLLNKTNVINGVMILLGSTAIGVAIIVYNSIIFELYFYKVNRPEYKSKVKTFAIDITIGVFLSILGATAFVACAYAEENNVLLAIFLVFGFLLIAVAVAIFIIYGLAWGYYIESLKKDGIIIPIEGHKEEGLSKFSGVIMLIATAIFLVAGFIWNAWHPAWVVFPVGGLFCGILGAIDDANKK